MSDIVNDKGHFGLEAVKYKDGTLLFGGHKLKEGEKTQ